MKHYWMKKDGSEILLQNMSTYHIKNCIKLLNTGRMNTDPLNWLPIFDKELILRKKKILNIKLKKLKN